jgi:hypothetical protein
MRHLDPPAPRNAARATFLALLLAAGTAGAASNSLLTAGVGAQYSYVSPDVASNPDAAGHQYGLVGRVKVLRFLGVEGVAQFDQDPKTQERRHLSPRFQLGAMLNLIPTSYFNLFAVAGLGAYRAGDLFNLDGRTTSFHGGPGLEVYLGDHVAVGGDVRFRVPGPHYLKEAVKRDLDTQPVQDMVGLHVWQANFTVSYYL